jgi:hypothetical protein
MKRPDPRTRRLVTGREAIKTTCQHRKPCADCPFARKALKGYTGSWTPEDFIQGIHGEVRFDCHTATVQCAGAAIFRANVIKCPRDKTLLTLPRDKDLVFANDAEFLAHHNSTTPTNGKTHHHQQTTNQTHRNSH